MRLTIREQIEKALHIDLASKAEVYSGALPVRQDYEPELLARGRSLRGDCDLGLGAKQPGSHHRRNVDLSAESCGDLSRKLDG